MLSSSSSNLLLGGGVMLILRGDNLQYCSIFHALVFLICESDQ